MDSNPTAAPTPATPEPADAPVAPQSLGGWFKLNGYKLAITAAVIAAVCMYLHPLDVLLAGLGLSFIIFIHELGHFATAKWFDVHVKTFSIGFGPALPFCHYKWGETTYKVAMIPLGGYVYMVGEGEENPDPELDPEDEQDDPRSLKAKPVWQRMIIISAGVVMNVLLGGACFVATYLHGVDEVPATVSAVEPGSGAWVAGIRPGSEITKIGSRENPWFDDIRPVVSSTSKGDTVPLTVSYQGQSRELSAAPVRQEGALLPQLGVAPPSQMVLRSFKRDDIPPYTPNSPAAVAKTADGQPGVRPGDRIVAMSDPDDPAKVTPLDPNWNQLPGAYFDYQRRLTRLAGQPVTVHVVRKDDATNTPVAVVLPPAYRKDVGLRMKMGEVTALRTGSAAEKAGVRVGDRITEVVFTQHDGKPRRLTADKTAQGAEPLDPMRLPEELHRWADSWPGRVPPQSQKVKLTVLRDGERTKAPLTLEVGWEDDYRDRGVEIANRGSPTAVGPLGVAYRVLTTVDAVAPGSSAAAAGLQPDDIVTQVRFKAVDFKGKESTGDWAEIQPHQWTFVDYTFQHQPPHAFDVKVKRGEQEMEFSLTGADDSAWPVWDRGLALAPERKVQKAADLWEAIEMGADRTGRSLKMIYLGLYSFASGLASPKLMSGPITLARASYLIAGEDIWHLLLWLGLISINLAVVNFLPIPVLDGGHMVFLSYEAIRGKPAPESVQVILTWIGVAFVLSLMLFVIGQDIWRLFW